MRAGLKSAEVTGADYGLQQQRHSDQQIVLASKESTFLRNTQGALFWDRIYEAGSKCQEKKANFSEGAPEELKGVAD